MFSPILDEFQGALFMTSQYFREKMWSSFNRASTSWIQSFKLFIKLKPSGLIQCTNVYGNSTLFFKFNTTACDKT